MPIQENQGAQRLVLRGSGNMSVDCEIGKKLADFNFSHLLRMAFVMIEDKLSYPVCIRFFRAQAVVLCPQGMVYLIQEFGFWGRFLNGFDNRSVPFELAIRSLRVEQKAVWPTNPGFCSFQ